MSAQEPADSAATEEAASEKAKLGEAMMRHLKSALALRRARMEDAVAPDHMALKIWQAERLAHTYRDLLEDARYGAAGRFVLTELYGTKDFTARDAEVERVIPKLVGLLPVRALVTLDKALRMDELCESLDADMVTQLRAAGRSQSIDWPAYAAAYRACARHEEREIQIAMVTEIGQALDRLTHKPLLGTLLKMMRAPAQRAGLGYLQSFLQQGFESFGHMRGAETFLGTITERETALMHHLFSGGQGPTDEAPPAR